MKKSKIAISLDASLLEDVDSKVDGRIIRSRSQAIEVFLRRGLFESNVKKAVILLKGDHQRFALKQIDGKALVLRQIEFFAEHGLESVIILTQKSDDSIAFMSAVSKAKLPTVVLEDPAKGNAHALFSIRSQLTEPFVVISGDTYNEFDLSKMVRKLLSASQVAIMGLMSRNKADLYGAAILDGDMVVRFDEKSEKGDSFVVNAGVYVFRPEVFDYMAENMRSLEKELFTELAKKHELLGFFTHGKYVHLPDQEPSDTLQDSR